MRLRHYIDKYIGKGASNTIRIAFIFSALLGSFSLYFSVQIFWLPESFRSLIDFTTLSSMAIQFYVAALVALFLSRFSNLLMLGILRVVTRSAIRARKRGTAVSTYQLVKFYRVSAKSEYVWGNIVIVLMIAYVLIGTVYSVILVGLLLIAGILVTTAINYVNFGRRWPLRSVSQHRRARANLTILLFLASIASIGLGVLRIKAKVDDYVAYTSVQGTEYRSVLFKTESGLILGPAKSGPLSETESRRDLLFVPFDSISSLAFSLN